MAERDNEDSDEGLAEYCGVYGIQEGRREGRRDGGVAVEVWWWRWGVGGAGDVLEM